MRWIAHTVRLVAGIMLVIPLTLASGRVAPTFAQATITCDPAALTPTDPASAAPAGSPPAMNATPFPENVGTVTVFAAASLTDAFGAIETDLEAANPGLDLVFNFAGSQALVTQLAEGAAAEVFASANQAQMNAGIEAGVIAGEPAIFATNRLAIVVPADNPAGISSPADLANDGVQLVLAADTVPVGQYARESICLMNADTAAYGDEFAARVADNVVSNETNVRNVLAKVQLGEADAGIVYITDVTTEAASDVTMIEIPGPVNRIATYPVAPVEGGDRESAAAFISYVLSADGRATLAEFGFQTP